MFPSAEAGYANKVCAILEWNRAFLGIVPPSCRILVCNWPYFTYFIYYCNDYMLLYLYWYVQGFQYLCSSWDLGVH